MGLRIVEYVKEDVVWHHLVEGHGERTEAVVALFDDLVGGRELCGAEADELWAINHELWRKLACSSCNFQYSDLSECLPCWVHKIPGLEFAPDAHPQFRGDQKLKIRFETTFASIGIRDSREQFPIGLEIGNVEFMQDPPRRSLVYAQFDISSMSCQVIEGNACTISIYINSILVVITTITFDGCYWSSSGTCRI